MPLARIPQLTILQPISAGGAFIVCLAFGGPVAGQVAHDFSRAVEQVRPAVVQIIVTRTPGAQSIGLGQAASVQPEHRIPAPARESLGRRSTRPVGPGATRELTGSGLILSPDGYALTARHLVAGADAITVRLSDGRQFSADLLAVDDRSALALLGTDARNLPAAKIAPAPHPKPGEWVVAVGASFGFANSVSAGIVSGTNRSLPDSSYVPYIQTDVGLPPGSAGGALVNLAGEVVGINTAPLRAADTFTGLSFAVPIAVAMDIAAQLRARGRVMRAWLGVHVEEVPHELARANGMVRRDGAMVVGVVRGGPAERAGLAVGDVVVAVDGRRLSRWTDLPWRVSRARVGEHVFLDVLRDGAPLRLHTTVDELPSERAVALTAFGLGAPKALDGFGIAVSDLPPEPLAPDGTESHGVMVIGTSEEPAVTAGVREGDIIVFMAGTEVHDAHELSHLASELPPRQPVPLVLDRAGTTLVVIVTKDEYGTGSAQPTVSHNRARRGTRR